MRCISCVGELNVLLPWLLQQLLVRSHTIIIVCQRELNFAIGLIVNFKNLLEKTLAQKQAMNPFRTNIND